MISRLTLTGLVFDPLHEPVRQTVILMQVGDWGVAFRRCADGLWYNAGRYAQSCTWDEVCDALEGRDVFMLGPNNPPEN